jgi:single-strand DNA-binding protein
MATINRVVLVGNLTRDPELRTSTGGTSICRLRVACNATRARSTSDRTSST